MAQYAAKDNHPRAPIKDETFFFCPTDATMSKLSDTHRKLMVIITPI
jgi:hypothetical protein